MVNFAEDEMIGEGLELPNDRKARVPLSLASDGANEALELHSLPTLEQVERKLIEDALKAANYNVSQVALALDVTKPRLYRMIDRHKIQLQRSR
jgi:transcriptional regulator with PAS, ATPase and Fis domain